MYISIPHRFGLEAIDQCQFQEDLHPRFRKELVLEPANFILQNSTSTFDSEFYLQIKGTAVATNFAPTYANLAMLYHDIKVFYIICLSYALARKHFENSRFGYLDEFQILLKANLIKPDHLLSILKQINSNITFIKEKSETRSTFSNIMIKESGIYNKSTGLQYIFCIRNRSVIKLD